MSRWTDFARECRETRGARYASTSAPNSRLEVTVIFTTASGTTAALEAVDGLAGGLDLRLTLLVLQAVPYALPLSRPPVNLDHLRRVALLLVTGVCASGQEIVIQIILCRDRDEGLRRAIPARSLVIVGARRCWWARSERRLARRLRSLGHEMIFVKAERVRQPGGKVPELSVAAWSTDSRGEQPCST